MNVLASVVTASESEETSVITLFLCGRRCTAYHSKMPSRRARPDTPCAA